MQMDNILGCTIATDYCYCWFSKFIETCWICSFSNIACPTIQIITGSFLSFTIVNFSDGFLLFESRQNFFYLDESSNWPSLQDVLVTMRAPGRNTCPVIFFRIHYVLVMGMDTCLSKSLLFHLSMILYYSYNIWENVDHSFSMFFRIALL